MIDLHFITGPLIGGIIGVATNGIAIKMLFRPLKPIRIGKFTLPFTPGLIPKEKPRLAKAIGKVIGEQLLDTETLQSALASDKLKEMFNRKIDSMIEKLGHEEGSVGDYLEKIEALPTIDQAVQYLENTMAEYIPVAIVEQNLVGPLVDAAAENVLENMNGVASLVAGPALQKAKPSIVMRIDEMLLQEGPDLLKEYADKEFHNWIDRPMSELGTYLWQNKEKYRSKIWELYLKILKDKSSSLLLRLDVGTIVEDKINAFDTAFLENLIMDIARKELHALVWLGGILGALLGLLN